MPRWPCPIYCLNEQSNKIEVRYVGSPNNFNLSDQPLTSDWIDEQDLGLESDGLSGVKQLWPSFTQALENGFQSKILPSEIAMSELWTVLYLGMGSSLKSYLPFQQNLMNQFCCMQSVPGNPWQYLHIGGGAEKKLRFTQKVNLDFRFKQNDKWRKREKYSERMKSVIMWKRNGAWG